jgi:hypothetical protein
MPKVPRFTLENPSHNKHMSFVILTQGWSCDLQKWIDYNGLQVQWYIFHNNREISILTMKKKPTARLTLLQEATESSKLQETKTNKKQKN